MAIKYKGEKYVIKLLREQTADDAKRIASHKEVFFDSLYEVQQIMIKCVSEDQGQSITVLKKEIKDLKKKYQKVDDVLKDVIKIIEFDVD